MQIISSNKKAFHNFFILDKLQVGIVLVGSEVKSIRDGSFSLDESYVTIKDNELFLRGAYIKPYEKTSSYAPDTKRTRKLLANKKEIEKLAKETSQKGLTLIATKAYMLRNNVKLEIALAKGKKLYDKREDLKEKKIKKDLNFLNKSLK